MARKSTHPNFKYEREYALPGLEGHLPASLWYWYNTKQGGEPREVYLEYRVTAADGPHPVVAYDGRGNFHRRGPAWPSFGDRTENFGQIPMKQRKNRAVDDIQDNRKQFEAVVPMNQRGNNND